MRFTVLPILCLTMAACVSPTSEGKKICGGRVELANIFETLRQRHDKDGDGQITPTEFTRGKKQFANHDRNRDGVITTADYPAGRFWNGFGPGMARSADRDKNKIVTDAEWRGMISMLDADGNGEITMQEFGKMVPATVTAKPKIMALSFDQNGNGKIEAVDFELLFVDLDGDGDGQLDQFELRGNQRLLGKRAAQPPKVGETAPDFTLPLCADPKKSIQLSSFRGDRPVALIFGSYT